MTLAALSRSISFDMSESRHGSHLFDPLGLLLCSLYSLGFFVFREMHLHSGGQGMENLKTYGVLGDV
jgi:hypothetical protein